MGSAVSLEGLSKSYAGHRAVQGLSLEVPRGTIFGLLGRNGAGKTTTIRILLDIIRPDSGSVRVLGQRMNGALRDRMGYLPEERGLYPKMKVLEMLEFQGRIKGLGGQKARRRSESWLQRLDLSAWSSRRVEELSKGMQQKLQFLAAILHEPELLILDEPFSGMDPLNQELLKDLMLELNRRGTTILLSTHLLDSAERLCREIALIHEGRAVLQGTLPEIKRQFGRRALRLEYEGDGSFLSTLPGVSQMDDYGQYVEVWFDAEADPQSILRACVERLELRSFERVSPTLHSIFLRLVGGPVNRA